LKYSTIICNIQQYLEELEINIIPINVIFHLLNSLRYGFFLLNGCDFQGIKHSSPFLKQFTILEV